MSRPAAEHRDRVDVEAMRRVVGDLARSFNAYPAGERDRDQELVCTVSGTDAEILGILQETKERLERAGYGVMRAGHRLFVQGPPSEPLIALADGPWAPGYYERKGRRAA